MLRGGKGRQRLKIGTTSRRARLVQTKRRTTPSASNGRGNVKSSEDAAVALANKKLLGRGLVLVRHNIFDNPQLGRFIIKKIADGKITAGDVSPLRLAESLTC
jgi:hypothetical protein